MLKKYVELQAFYRSVFNTSAGKKVFADLADNFHLFSNSVDLTNDKMVYVNEGSRKVLLFILNRLGKTDAEALAEGLLFSKDAPIKTRKEKAEDGNEADEPTEAAGK